MAILLLLWPPGTSHGHSAHLFAARNGRSSIRLWDYPRQGEFLNLRLGRREADWAGPLNMKFATQRLYLRRGSFLAREDLPAAEAI